MDPWLEEKLVELNKQEEALRNKSKANNDARLRAYTFLLSSFPPGHADLLKFMEEWKHERGKAEEQLRQTQQMKASNDAD